MPSIERKQSFASGTMICLSAGQPSLGSMSVACAGIVIEVMRLQLLKACSSTATADRGSVMSVTFISENIP